MPNPSNQRTIRDFNFGVHVRMLQGQFSVGLAPAPVGASPWRDAGKAGTWAKAAVLSRSLQRQKS